MLEFKYSGFPTCVSGALLRLCILAVYRRWARGFLRPGVRHPICASGCFDHKVVVALSYWSDEPVRRRQPAPHDGLRFGHYAYITASIIFQLLTVV